MIDALRPSTLGEILDRTANLYRKGFLVFLGIAVMPASVILGCAAVSVLFVAWVGTRGYAAGPAAVGVMSIAFLTVGGSAFLPLCAGAAGWGAGALNHAAAAALDGEAMTIRGAYGAAWKRGWRYLWLLVLEGLIIVWAPAVLWTGVVAAFAIGQGARGSSTPQMGAGAIGLVLLLITVIGLYALWMLLLLCLAFPACVVENVGAWTAVKRAIALSRGTRGRILVLYILGMLLRWGISLVLTIPAILIITLVPGVDTPQHAQVIGAVMMVVIYGGSFLVRAATKPIYTIAQMSFYYDQRIRKEGFDIELLMRHAGMVQAPAALPEGVPWMPPLPAKSGVSAVSVEPEVVPGTSEMIAAQTDATGQIDEPVQIAREENMRPEPNGLPPLPGEPA